MAPTKKSSSTRSSSRSGASRSRSTGRSGGGGSRRSSGNGAGSDEADRYRRAAEDALQQLDWAIGYLHGIHKTDISKALAKNRSQIRTQLLGEPEESLPNQQTDET